MKKISIKFDEVWQNAEKFNKESRTERFHRIFQQRNKYVIFGIYDSVTKKYAIFDSINLAGNFRYDNNVVPQEVRDMENMVRAAVK
jgi:hypothetical protein